ncbi:MAG: anti-sigma factor family protein [Chloroflexota bacterium]
MQELSNHLTDEQLSVYFDERLPANEQSLVDEHITACNACRLALHELEATVLSLRSLPEPSLPRSFLIREQPPVSILSRILSWDFGIRSLASVAAALFIVVLSIDLTAMNRPAGIVPLNAATQARPVSSASGPLPQPTAALQPTGAGAPAPVPAAARRQPEAATESAAPQATDSARLEALVTRDAGSSMANSLSALSPLTLTIGTVAVLLILVAVVRSVRQA